MKIALSLIALFAASQAFASGTSIGNGRVNCREGSTDSFWVQSSEGNGVTERYVCRRGQWESLQEAPKPVKSATCREGQVEHFPGSYESGGQKDTNFICRNGQFVPYHP